MLVGEFLEVERPVRLDVEPFAQEAVHAKGGRVLEPHAELEVDIPQETGLEAVENDFIPDDAGGEEAALAV